MVPEMFPVPLRYLIMFLQGAPTLIPFYSERISPISFKNKTTLITRKHTDTALCTYALQ